jgi:hypothetical protein
MNKPGAGRLEREGLERDTHESDEDENGTPMNPSFVNRKHRVG